MLSFCRPQPQRNMWNRLIQAVQNYNKADRSVFLTQKIRKFSLSNCSLTLHTFQEQNRIVRNTKDFLPQ